MPKIIGTVYKDNNEYGDFEWMIRQTKYNDALFLFNDNMEHHMDSNEGAGNACIRKYNRFSSFHKYPRSAGIITGSLRNGGFAELDKSTKNLIDINFEEIKYLIKKFGYKRIFYSRDKKSKKLGTCIFDVDDDVLKYITKKIYRSE